MDFLSSFTHPHVVANPIISFIFENKIFVPPLTVYATTTLTLQKVHK